MEEWMEPYLAALIDELKSWEQPLRNNQIKTIFLGGGTPTLFHGEQIRHLLEACRDYLDVSESAEITIEGNPGTVDFEKLSILHEAGVNRLSMGLQAWQPRLLKTLGRIHSRQDWLDAILWAQKAGFDNINVDIMFGLPGQTLDEWRETIEEVCKRDIQHVSTYSLKIEEGTPFQRRFHEGKLALPSEEEEREMYHTAIGLFREHGLWQYEISNFAKEGRECRHNLIYWNNEWYIGCGAGAHSYFNGERFSNTAHIKDYIAAVGQGQRPVVQREVIDREDEIFETIMLGLRLIRGIQKTSFFRRFGVQITDLFHDEIKLLKEEGLMEEGEDSVFLTLRGLDLQNTVLLTFMK